LFICGSNASSPTFTFIAPGFLHQGKYTTRRPTLREIFVELLQNKIKISKLTKKEATGKNEKLACVILIPNNYNLIRRNYM